MTFDMENVPISGPEHGVSKHADASDTAIVEGKAEIKTAGKVFYNPVQEFNRDLSISVLNAFIKGYMSETTPKTTKNGFKILEALSATGLRSIRYAKEVTGVTKIIANDLSSKAVEDIKRNIADNGVEDIVTASLCDATMLMYQHRQDKFDAIDLDPYGCPTIFLDGAVQAIANGGLLLVTATDMAVLAGNTPETCYTKYGAISLRTKSCHEMALRILLQHIESHANRYGKYTEPLLSISADFYIRVFVRVFNGAHTCKYTLSKLARVYHCTACDSYEFESLGTVSTGKKGHPKFGLPTFVNSSGRCKQCNHSLHVGGPIWASRIHNEEFVQDVIAQAKQVHRELGTTKRIEGVLGMVVEELPDVPLYMTLERLSSTLHAQTPPMLTIRSALLFAGYEVSFTHAHKTGIKTNAPIKVLWDVMRCWIRDHPISERHLKNDADKENGMLTTCQFILQQQSPVDYNLTNIHPQANPASRRDGRVRFQENPTRYWGPGTRNTAMIGDPKASKKVKNQGKRKRTDDSSGNDETV